MFKLFKTKIKTDQVVGNAQKLDLNDSDVAVPEVRVEGVDVKDDNDKQQVEIDYDGAVPEFHILKKEAKPETENKNE